MSQARVTDFYYQRKKSIAAPVKPTKPRRSTAVGSDSANTARTRSTSKNKDVSDAASVHAEFLRVIDEALGESAICSKDLPPSPRTPKRTASEFDLGTAVFSGSAEHSTAKKRRQATVAKTNAPEKGTRKKARKKLDLPQDSPQAQFDETSKKLASPASPAPGPDAEGPASVRINRSPQIFSKTTRGQTSQALSRDDIAALKSRLQKIKKRSEETPSSASAPTLPSSSPSLTAAEPSSTTSDAPKTAPPHTSDAKALRFSVARAKELAAKVQKRTEERAAEGREPPVPDSGEQPAYQRYHNLAQAAPPGLSLPYRYKILAEMFRSMDTVVAMLHNRSETATFSKIKKGVQDMMHKQFEESHVSQIQTVLPDAYRFRQEKNIPTFNNNVKRGSYQLTVEPVVQSDLNESRPFLSASRLLERRQVFHQNLVSLVKQHHQAFLSSLVPPMSVPEDKLTRWHPRFNVDTVPDVRPGTLPQPPHVEKLATAQEVLDKARSLLTPKMEKALESLALKTEVKVEIKEEKLDVPQTPPPPVPAALKGVSQSLLDRIRAKEAQKLQAAMTRNPAQEDRLLMMSRLPELARILRNVFVAEKRPCLIMEVVCSRMVASYRSALSAGEMEKHVRLLAELASDWLTIHPIRKDFYLKLNKNTEVNAVVDKLNSRMKEEERS